MSHNNIVSSEPISLAQEFSQFAAALRDDGTSFLPIKLNGSKKPDWSVLPLDELGDPEWLPLQTRLPTNAEVSKWFGNGVARGIGIIQGRVSSEQVPRELLDVDVEQDERRAKLAYKFLADERVREILHRCPLVATPSGGYHVYYRCEQVEGNQVLAKLLDGKSDDGKTIPKTFMETRGDGGYSAAPPTPGYRLINQIPIELTPIITADERALLFQVAREFGEVMIPTREHRLTVQQYDDPDPTRPGSIFNRVASWQDILEPKGWTHLFGDDDVGHWQRPEKPERTTSAQTIGHVLLCYSTNASPFEAWSASNRIGYTKFHAYTLLYHAGDFFAAAKDLAEEGYNDTEYYSHGDLDQKIESICGSYHAVDVGDEGSDLLRGEVVEDHEPRLMTSPQICTEARFTDNIKDDPLYAYLWRGYHGRFLTDAQRDKRIASTQEALEFVPPNSVFTDYLAGAMPTTDAPVWFHVASALSLSAYIINRQAYLMDGNRMCFPLFWIGVLAGSGTMHKSATINPVRQILRDDLDLGSTLVRATTWAQLIDKIGIELRRKTDDDTRPTAAEARSMCEMEDQEARCLNGLAYFHLGEIATLLASLNKTYNEEAKPTLTDWWDCPPDDLYETKTAGKYYIYRPFVSILGASTVDWFISGCKHSDLMGGFLPRWLFFANGVQDFQLSQPDPADETIAEPSCGALPAIEAVSRQGRIFNRSRRLLQRLVSRQLQGQRQRHCRLVGTAHGVCQENRPGVRGSNLRQHDHLGKFNGFGLQAGQSNQGRVVPTARRATGLLGHGSACQAVRRDGQGTRWPDGTLAGIEGDAPQRRQVQAGDRHHGC